jgi:hypothetical protein
MSINWKSRKSEIKSAGLTQPVSLMSLCIDFSESSGIEAFVNITGDPCAACYAPAELWVRAKMGLATPYCRACVEGMLRMSRGLK